MLTKSKKRKKTCEQFGITLCWCSWCQLPLWVQDCLPSKTERKHVFVKGGTVVIFKDVSLVISWCSRSLLASPTRLRVNSSLWGCSWVSLWLHRQPANNELTMDFYLGERRGWNISMRILIATGEHNSRSNPYFLKDC